MNNAINWFEIPCRDLASGASFYERALDLSLKRESFMGVPHAIFPADEKGVRGALVQDERNAPSKTGTLLYLNVQGKLDATLERVEKFGGKIVLPKTSIGPNGFMAIVLDTEGNRVGLHSL